MCDVRCIGSIMRKMEMDNNDRILMLIIYFINYYITFNSGSVLYHVHCCSPCFVKVGLPLLVHGEVTAQSVDIFDRETVFIESELQPLVR